MAGTRNYDFLVSVPSPSANLLSPSTASTIFYPFSTTSSANPESAPSLSPRSRSHLHSQPVN